MNDFLKRTWAQINLDAIDHNFAKIRDAINKNSKILCVLKADAYGHGAEILAAEYEKLGADWFAVSNLEEALQLRHSKIKKPILILGYTPANMAKTLSKYNISQTVFSKSYAKELASCAQKAKVNVNVHIKLDTGMSRIGFMFQDSKRDYQTLDEIKNISQLNGLVLEGMFTHFAVADETGESEISTLHQLEQFNTAIEELKQDGVEIPLKHCSNSAGIINYPQANLDMVRAGLILYGLYPSDFQKSQMDLIPAMELKTVISQIKEVDKGTKVSYGGIFTTQRKTKIATVPIGYADGYLRCFSNRAHMLVNGEKARVIGRVCMDQLMLDVTDIQGVEEGSEVTVFGTDKKKTISLDELAGLSNTINYELLCLLSKRVPRIYIKSCKKVCELNYICPHR